MKIINRRGRLLITGIATLTACGTLVGAAPTIAASARPGTARSDDGCVTIDLIEPTPTFYSNIPFAPGVEYQVGFEGAAFDTLYDSTGTTKIGSSVVSTANVYKRASDGHVFEHIAETLQLGDGSFAGTGTFDRMTVGASAWQFGRVDGLTGRYAGLSGTWTWRLQSIKPPYPTEEIAVLCPTFGDR